VRIIDVVVLLFLKERERETGRERYIGKEREMERESNNNMTLPYSSVMTRSVWSYNLESEFEMIHSVIALYPFILMDTEFPGAVFQSHSAFRQPQNNYAVMKANLDSMHLIQVGLTLSDDNDNLWNLQPLHLGIQLLEVRCDTTSSCSSLHRPPSTSRHGF